MKAMTAVNSNAVNSKLFETVFSMVQRYLIAMYRDAVKFLVISTFQ